MRGLSHGVRHIGYRDGDTRLRAIWRGLVPGGVGFLGASLLIPVVLIALRGLLDLSALGSGTRAILEFGIIGTASAVGLIIAVSLATRLDGRPIAGYGVGVSLEDGLDLLVGTAIGGLTYAIPTAVLLAVGRATLSPTAAESTGSPPVILVAVLVAVFAFLAQVTFEEFVFRGVMLKNFAEGISSRGLPAKRAILIAVATSSLLFGAFHVVRQGGGGVEGRSVQLVLTSTLLGLLWGAGYVLTGRLSVPLGLHLGHNLWPAVLLQPDTLGVVTPAIGTVDYAAGTVELTVWKVAVGVILLLVWVGLSRGEISIERGVARRD